MQLTTSTSKLKGVGDYNQKLLEKLDVHIIADLIYRYPRQYLDYSKQVKISHLDFEKKQTLIAEVKSIRNIFLRGRGGRTMQRGTLRDDTGEIEVIWFNMPFVENALQVGEKYAFIAKVSTNKKTGKLQINAPQFEKISEDMIHSSRIVPVYQLTTGLSPKKYRRYIKQIVDQLTEIEDLPQEYIPDLLAQIQSELEDKKFIPHTEAIEQIHFPDNFDKLKQARFRLGVEELVPIQTKLIKQAQMRAQAKPVTKNLKEAELIKQYWKQLPFEPTKDQLKACKQILEDFNLKPIYRLIQGDVGSGKTAVAGFAASLCLQAGKDVVLMVPTTVLANQHFQNLKQFFPEIELVTAETDIGKNTNSKKTRKSKLYIGTQALLHRYENIDPNLGMLIVDEEHRFGVKQREQMAKLTSLTKEKLPHYLSLTATPIPRTLALSIFGNIDISIIKSKPITQKPKITYIVPEYKREDSYTWVKENIEKGEQVFWICPLVEQTKEVEDMPVIISKDDKSSVEATYKDLQKIYPDLKIAKLHGKLKDATKQKILKDFREGKYQILVSTTVIEVGIDIPGANLIAIENASNFGLAQLHQLRGRVGRGERQGYCLLFDNSEEETAIKRLKYFAEESDGLELAKYDLELRGPGEVYGKIQSGVPNLQIADMRDEKQIHISRLVATAQLNQKN